MNRPVKLLIAAVALVTACSEQSGSPPVDIDVEYGAVEGSEDFLPYGVAIAREAILTRSPQPYNPRRHGPPSLNTHASENAANDVELLRSLPDRSSRLKARAKRLPYPGDADAGFNIAFTGINVRNDAQYDVYIPLSEPVGTVLYAPTHTPSQYSCLEATTVHRKETSVIMRDYHGFWDWCEQLGQENFDVLEEMTSGWLDKYTRLYAGYGGGTAEPSFYVQVYSENPSVPNGSCWVGMLYNFNTGLWEQKIRRCGSSQLDWRFGFPTGWTMWEEWFLTSCPTFPSIKASFIRKQGINFSWNDVGEFDLIPFSYGSCWSSGYWINRPVYGEWQARTPN